MEQNFFQLLHEYWTLIATIVSLVISYTKLNSSVKGLETRMTCVETDIKEMNPVWHEIKERLVSIETSLSIHFKNK